MPAKNRRVVSNLFRGKKPRALWGNASKKERQKYKSARLPQGTQQLKKWAENASLAQIEKRISSLRYDWFQKSMEPIRERKFIDAIKALQIVANKKRVKKTPQTKNYQMTRGEAEMRYP